MTDKINVLDKDTIDQKSDTRNQKPSMWNVILLNDDYSTFDFVIFVLEKIFHKSHQDAVALMLDVHLSGKGIAGTYCYEVAETKQTETMNMAKLEQHPLLVVLEKI